jgi:chitin synthase
VPEFISQRRRWLNGAFFAAVYSIFNAKQIWKTDHSLARKILLHIEFVYQTLNLLFTYFGLVSILLLWISVCCECWLTSIQANFYLAFYFIAGSLTDEKLDPFGHDMGKYIFIVLRYACVLVMCLQFIISLGNRPQGYVHRTTNSTYPC